MIVPVDITGVCLETPRLLLRPWQETDVQDFYEYASVDGVGQMAGWAPHKSLEESKTILKLFMEEKKTFALVDRKTQKVIGSIGLEERDAPGEIPGQGRELGYVLAKPYWGQGLMPEAVKEVIRYCFDTLHWDWVTCAHFISNRQSRRVIEKCGFTYLGDILFETRIGTVEPTKAYILYNQKR